MLIIDEGDKMLNMGFVDQIKDIFKAVPKNVTTALFSATVPEEIKNLVDSYMNEPKFLEVKAKLVNEGKIHESFVKLDKEAKLKNLRNTLYAKNPESAIVFCNTKDEVRSIARLLSTDGIVTCEIHGDMEQKDRIEVMKKFKNKEFKVMVATDLAARGIHIEHIELVINYEVPKEQDAYVHRIGRTGRAGKEGDAITFVSSYEERYLREVEEYIERRIPQAEAVSDDIAKACKANFKDSQRKMIDENKGKRAKEVHKDVMKLHLTGGKKKKIRPLDVVGAVSNLKGLTGDDVGIIDVQDGFTFVDILNGKGNIVLKNYKEITIKGKKIKVSRAQS